MSLDSIILHAFVKENQFQTDMQATQFAKIQFLFQSATDFQTSLDLQREYLILIIVFSHAPFFCLVLC